MIQCAWAHPGFHWEASSIVVNPQPRTTRRKPHWAGEGAHADRIIYSRRFRCVDELKSDASRSRSLGFKLLTTKPLVLCNGRCPSPFLFICQLTTGPHPLRFRNGSVVRISLLQVAALTPLLITRDSSAMKLTMDRSATGCIILGVGALVLLPSVKAAAQCVGGWDWVRSYLFLVPCGL